MKKSSSTLKKTVAALLLATLVFPFGSTLTRAQTTSSFPSCPEASLAMQLPEPQVNFTSNISEYFLANGYLYTLSTNAVSQPITWDKKVFTVSKVDPVTGQVLASQSYSNPYPFEHPLNQKVYGYTGRPFKHEFVVTSDDKAFIYRKAEGGGNIAVLIFDLNVPREKNNNGVKIVEMPDSEDLEANGLAVDQHDAIYLQMSSSYTVTDNRHDKILKLDKEGNLITTVLDIQHDTLHQPEAYLTDYYLDTTSGEVYTLTMEYYQYPKAYHIVRKYIIYQDKYYESTASFISSTNIFHSFAVDTASGKIYLTAIPINSVDQKFVMYDKATYQPTEISFPAGTKNHSAAYFEKAGNNIYLNLQPPYDESKGTRSYLVQNGNLTDIIPATCSLPTHSRVLVDSQANIFFEAHPQDALWPNMQMGVIFKNPLSPTTTATPSVAPTTTPTVQVTATPTASPTPNPTATPSPTPTVGATSTPQPTPTIGRVTRPRVTQSPNGK